MSYAITLGSMFVVHMLTLISPGPNVLIVTQTAMRRTRRAGMATALGISTVSLIWAAAALIGLNIVFAHYAWLYGGLKVVGGIYLVYLAIRMWKNANQPLERAEAADQPVTSSWQAYRLGCFTNMTNPKAAIFYGSIFTAFLTPETPAWMKGAALCLTTVDSLLFHTGLAFFFSTDRVKEVYEVVKRRVDRFAGTALGLLGLKLLVSDIAAE